MTGALLVAGTGSDAGKSVVCAGLCRWLARQGLRVAPFKAQNMALNSAVTADGAEIGRAQAAQAQAAGARAEAAMNPILIKPQGEAQSQVMVMGKPAAVSDAQSYQRLKERLRPAVSDALEDLLGRFDAVVCEGAGSPAEINLRHADLANMGLARAFDLPVAVVGDIDRGGVFASLFGSLALLEPDDQRLVQGFFLNKFRGDRALLDPGLDELARRTARPVLGVLPWVADLWLDAEDSLDLDGHPGPPPAAAGTDTLDVCVLRLRWMSNFTDFDALACESGVSVRFTESPAQLERADLVIVPGTKATVQDLARLRERGLDRTLRRRVAEGSPVLAICGGYQMLGESICDGVESGLTDVRGLGLVPASTEFAQDKVLRQRDGIAPAFSQAPVTGYEIRHGRVRPAAGRELFKTPEGPEGLIWGSVLATSWHGVLDCDEFRRAVLRWVSDIRGLRIEFSDVAFTRVRERRLDALGDLIEAHTDTDALLRLICEGPRASLPCLFPHSS